MRKQNINDKAFEDFITAVNDLIIKEEDCVGAEAYGHTVRDKYLDIMSYEYCADEWCGKVEDQLRYDTVDCAANPRYWFSGVSKLVYANPASPTVMKIYFDTGDIHESEAALWDELKDTWAAKYFCPSYFGFEWEGFYVEFQMQAPKCDDKNTIKIRDYRYWHDEETIKSYLKDYHDNSPEQDTEDLMDWRLAKVFLTLGRIDEISKFYHLCESYGINDLHDGNFVMTKDGFKIYDYCGYSVNDI